MRIAVLGGGAAGMMAAATINETAPQVEVFLIEKNDDLGKKVLISGGGRCNVTTGIEDVKTVLTKYPRGSKFLISAMHNFPPLNVRSWFEEHGVPLKCEDDLRVFPVSDKGADVVNAFKKIFKGKTSVLTKHVVKKLEKVDEGFRIVFKEQEAIIVDRVILAVGGQAYRHTGSTGDGYTLAESFGHHITSLAPSLHSFITKEKWVGRLAGISFAEAELICPSSPKPNSFIGSLLFTHRGITGPAVFALSSLIAFHPLGDLSPLDLKIDLFPTVSLLELEGKIKKAMQDSTRKSFKNTLQQFVPLTAAEITCEENGIPGEKKNAEISNEERSKVVNWLKNIPFQVTLRGVGHEFVTAGGVDLSEVDPRTMESKIVDHLYFAGEVLNIDGFTGGFNLQASWVTGRLAGLNCTK